MRDEDWTLPRLPKAFVQKCPLPFSTPPQREAPGVTKLTCHPSAELLVFHSQKTIEGERQKLLSDFERLRQFLHDQEHILLGQLDKMEKNISKRQNENITDLSKEITLLNKLITELEEKIQQPMLEFLKVRCHKLIPPFSMCLYILQRVLGVKVLFYSVFDEWMVRGGV